jgi:hypothetical protein
MIRNGRAEQGFQPARAAHPDETETGNVTNCNCSKELVDEEDHVNHHRGLPARQEETEMVSPKQAETPRYRSKKLRPTKTLGKRKRSGSRSPGLRADATSPTWPPARRRPGRGPGHPDQAQIGPAPPAEYRVAGTPSNDDWPSTCCLRRRRATRRRCLGRRSGHPAGPKSSPRRRQSTTCRLRRGPALHTPRRPHRHLAVLTVRPPPATDATVRLQNRWGGAERHYVPPPPSPTSLGLASGRLGGRRKGGGREGGRRRGKLGFAPTSPGGGDVGAGRTSLQKMVVRSGVDHSKSAHCIDMRRVQLSVRIHVIHPIVLSIR